jgi:hypothetical protein
MNFFESCVAVVVDGLILTTLAGLVVRRHLLVCYTFGLYLFVTVTADFAMLASADFYTRKFWLVKEVVVNALRFAMALEITGRTFSAFPGARATARVFLLPFFVLLAGGAVFCVLAVTGFPGIEREWAILIGQVQPRILTGFTWLLTALAALILWYRLPIEHIHKAILIGYVPYLILSTVTLQLWQANNWPTEGWLMWLDTGAYLVLLSYWAVSAWQPARDKITPPRPLTPVERPVG